MAYTQPKRVNPALSNDPRDKPWQDYKSHFAGYAGPGFGFALYRCFIDNVPIAQAQTRLQRFRWRYIMRARRRAPLSLESVQATLASSLAKVCGDLLRHPMDDDARAFVEAAYARAKDALMVGAAVKYVRGPKRNG